MDWAKISQYQNLSESFIEKFHDRVDWRCISFNCNIKLSSSFYERFADRLDWSLVSEFHKLSEAAIEKFADRLDWERISNIKI